MKKYLWTIGGEWSEASSIDDLKEFYQRSGNLQGDFVAIEINDMGNKVNITNRIKGQAITQHTETTKPTSKKNWWGNMFGKKQTKEISTIQSSESIPKPAQATPGPASSGVRNMDSEILQAVTQGDIAEVRKLLEAGANVNARGPYDVTPLYKAVDGSNEMIALLLESGADRNPRVSELSHTPLHVAAYHGRTEAAALLLEAGADIEARNINGDTPLRDAVYYNCFETAVLLLDRGADVNAQDDKKWTPLHFAAQRGHTEMAILLLDRGADLNAPNIHGKTPLSEAAWMGSTETAALLIDRGADVNAQDAWGKTAMNRAEEFSNPAIAALLKQQGAVN